MTKVAESNEDRTRLGREAAILRAVAHPAVVRVAGVEGSEAPERLDRLRLHRVTGPSLAESMCPPRQIAAGWGAAVATVIGDLHELGFVHGAVTADHVLIDERGRPILCGFGRAGRVQEMGRSAADDDVRAVAQLVCGLLGPGHDRVRRAVRQWETGRRRRRSGARALARALVHAVPDAAVMPIEVRRPGDTQESGVAFDPAVGGETVERPLPSAGRKRRATALGLAGLVAATGVALLASSLAGPGRDRRASAVTGPYNGYVLRAAPGERPLTVVGRWRCGPARPAVLDTASGAIWTFAAWPTSGGPVRGTFVRRVPGASGLAAVSRAPGCDDLLVIRAGHADLPLTLGST